MSGVSAAMLARARQTAQDLMDSTVLIRRETGKVRNPANGELEKTWQDIYKGPARVRLTDADPRDVDAVGQRFAVQRPTLSLPVDLDPRIELGTSAAVRVDDVVTVIANDHDPGQVGAVVRIAGWSGQTHSTARRMRVEVLSYA